MNCFRKYFFYFPLILLANKGGVFGLHPHVGLDEYEIMDKYGYKYEKHFVTTEDGYILELLRLPHTSYFNSSIPFKIYPELVASTPGEPILLIHCLTSSARMFFLHYPEKALPFILYNHGYDVFLGNLRGTARSRRHVTLDPDLDVKEFWNYSWHEIGIYDITVMIDYILALTNFKQLSYVGHSQGGTSFFAMASYKPEMNKKIKIAFSLAGPGVLGHDVTPSIKQVCSMEERIGVGLEHLEIYEFTNCGKMIENLAKLFAADIFGLQDILINILNILGIITTHNVDMELIPVMAKSMPAGSSAKQLIHYMQSVRMKDFRLFDYHDKEKNLEKYGSEIPPRYNLSAITSKLVLYYSKSDYFVKEKDILFMTKLLPNAVAKEIKIEMFGHCDFLLARNVDKVVFEDMLKRLKNA